MKTVSIVIPCRNEEKYIASCLDSLIHTTYPKEYLSIFVCDGLSDDQTPSIVSQYAAKYSYIELLINKMQTTPYALNLGIQHQNSDVVIILGAHSTVASDFIDKNVEVLFSDATIGCAGGVLTNSYENKQSQIIGYAMSQPFGVGNAHFRTGAKAGFVDTVAFGSYKREVFEKIGYFDEDLTRNQDDDFNYRLTKAGYRIFLSPEIQSFYVVRSSFHHLFRQYFQYGYWKVFVNQKHKRITSFRQLIPFFFVSFIVLGSILSVVVPYFNFAYSFFCLLYLLMAFWFTQHQPFSFKERWMIVWTFLTLHVSYGSGYCAGIWDFIIFEKKPKSKFYQLSR